MSSVDLLDLAALIMAGAGLLYASISDVRTREVSNTLWLILLPAGGVTTGIRFLVYPELTLLIVVSLAIIVLISLGGFYSGIFGGADAKAFMCLATLTPLIPTSVPPFLGPFHPFFAITMLVNSFLVSSLSAVGMLIRNLPQLLFKRGGLFRGFEQESVLTKLSALFSGFRIPLADLESKSFYFPMEAIDEDPPARRIKLIQNVEEDRGLVIGKLREQVSPQDTVWATPALPHLLFLGIGFLLTLFIGDLILWVMLAAMYSLIRI